MVTLVVCSDLYTDQTEAASLYGTSQTAPCIQTVDILINDTSGKETGASAVILFCTVFEVTVNA